MHFIAINTITYVYVQAVEHIQVCCLGHIKIKAWPLDKVR